MRVVMIERTDRYFCDVCGSEIPPKEYWGNDGAEITIKDGIVARPVKMDLCKSCYENLRTYCANHKKDKAEEEQ